MLGSRTTLHLVNHFFMRPFLSLTALLLFAGCQSAPKPAQAPAASAPVPVVEVKPAEPVVEVEAVPQRTAAALEARDLLLKGAQNHQVLMTSAFRGHPGFTTAGWSGLVLSPKDLRQGIVVGSGYWIQRVEVHPLADGRLRVWVEVSNRTDVAVHPEGACEFRPTETQNFVKFKPLPVIPANGKVLVSFESEKAHMDSYSVLIRSVRQ